MYSIDSKMFCLCADNMNTNFGSVKRREGNVFRKLRNPCHDLFLELAAHILHNTVRVSVEVIMMKVYNFFFTSCWFKQIL